jgi:hypothetical protein
MKDYLFLCKGFTKMSVCSPIQKLSQCGIGSFNYTCTPDLTMVYRFLVLLSMQLCRLFNLYLCLNKSKININ